MRNEEEDRSNGGDGGDEKVPFHKLFSFANPLDVVLMSVGTVAAIGNGISMPLMALIFGQLINSFGDADRSNVVHEVSKVWVLENFLLGRVCATFPCCLFYSVLVNICFL